MNRLQLAAKAGQNPAPYVAQARQWLAIVKMTNPTEAQRLETELNRLVGSAPARTAAQPPAWDPRFVMVRLAWVGVPFAILFMIAGGNSVIQVLAGVCLVCLLALIFLD